MKVSKEKDLSLIDNYSNSMKKLVLFLMMAAVITACDNNSKTKKDLEGKEVISRYTNGLAQIERDYKMIDGKRVGVYEWEYYEDGNTLKEGPLGENEKRDGAWKSYYRDGQLWSEGDFENGLRQGKTITYQENGNKYYVGQFNKNQKTGVWKFFKEDGEFDYEIDYTKRAKTKIEIDSVKLKEQLKAKKEN